MLKRHPHTPHRAGPGSGWHSRWQHALRLWGLKVCGCRTLHRGPRHISTFMWHAPAWHAQRHAFREAAQGGARLLTLPVGPARRGIKVQDEGRLELPAPMRQTLAAAPLHPGEIRHLGRPARPCEGGLLGWRMQGSQFHSKQRRVMVAKCVGACFPRVAQLVENSRVWMGCFAPIAGRSEQMSTRALPPQLAHSLAPTLHSYHLEGNALCAFLLIVEPAIVQALLDAELEGEGGLAPHQAQRAQREDLAHLWRHAGLGPQRRLAIPGDLGRGRGLARACGIMEYMQSTAGNGSKLSRLWASKEQSKLPRRRHLKVSSPTRPGPGSTQPRQEAADSAGCGRPVHTSMGIPQGHLHARRHEEGGKGGVNTSDNVDTSALGQSREYKS